MGLTVVHLAEEEEVGQEDSQHKDRDREEEGGECTFNENRRKLGKRLFNVKRRKAMCIQKTRMST